MTTMRRRWLSTFSSFSPNLKNKGVLRYDRYAKSVNEIDGKYEYDNLLALWVADMDFQSPRHILSELSKCANYGMFNYPHITNQDKEIVMNYLKTQHSYPDYPLDSLVYLPGLVVALNVCAKAFASPDEAVAVFTPVYPPFISAPLLQHRYVANIPLIRKDSKCTFFFDALKKRIEKSPDLPPVKVLFLCNPHNPVGRSFSKQEVNDLLEYCASHGVTVVSDEIHCDLILNKNMKHVSALGLGKDDNVVVLHSPSKTFNLAGIGCAYAVIPNSKLRSQFKKEMKGIVSDVSTFGLAAIRSAYSSESLEWKEGLLTHLRENSEFLSNELKTKLPQIKFDSNHHEATYLAWLDCTELNKKLNPTNDLSFSTSKFFLTHANIAMNDGPQFYGGGIGGQNFVRLNFACSQSILEEAVARMVRAVQQNS